MLLYLPAATSALKMTVLTAIIHFVVLSPWLTQQVSGLDEQPDSCQLDLAKNAFDDQYEGCIEQMEIKAPLLLKEELKMNKEFKKQWENAEKLWKKKKNTQEIKEIIPKSFHDFYGIALVTYTGSIGKDFNKAVREFRHNPRNFHFKAFHYYLTRALQLLSTGKCYTVYRRCHTKFQYSGSGNVRFGQFTSTSLKEEVTRQFGGSSGTLFTIKTCLGVYIKYFSHYPNEEEVLLPGYEVYQQVSKERDRISLGDPKKGKSNYNCLYVSSTNPAEGKLRSSINSSGKREGSTILLLLPGFLLTLLLSMEL